MRRFPHLIPLTIIAIVIGAITFGVSFLIDWLPVQAAEQAERSDTMLWFLIICSNVIFTGVATVLVYEAWRFRAKPGDDGDGDPIHGHTKLEVVWTVIPIVFLMGTAVWAYMITTDNEALAADRTEVEVTAQQFEWQYTYRDATDPAASFSTGDLVVPIGGQVRLKMRSKDVIHSFYVPVFRLKLDVVPGITTYMVFNPNRVGTYKVICTELCGVGHGIMRSRVIVKTQADYDAWRAEAVAQVKGAGATSAPTDATPSSGAPATTTTTP